MAILNGETELVMNKRDKAILPQKQHQMLADTFDALGHKRRVEIFKQLSLYTNQQVQFGHLCTLSGLTPATLSFHLNKMQKGGLVVRKQVGNATHICLQTDHLHRAMSMIANA